MAKNKEKGKLFKEFKQFISKGNVVDLAVGVIIGGAFSAIVTALTSQILQPLINWIIALCGGGQALESARIMLQPAYVEGTELIDWANSIYIDIGAFITAIINFFLIALVLFIIVKIINKARESSEKIKAAELEKYYQKHPKERPAPVVPGAPKPTEAELLTEIRDLLKTKK